MGLIQRQSFKSSIATYIGIVIGAVNLIILFPRFLTPEQLGLTRVLIAASLIFSQVSLLGTPYALIRFFPFFKNQEQKHFGFPALMMWLTLGGFTVISLLVFALHAQIEDLYSKNSPLFSSHFLWLFPLALFMTLSEMVFSYTRTLLKMPIPIFFKEVMLRLVQTGAIILLILKMISFEQFLTLFVCSYLVQLLLLCGYVVWLKQFFFFAPIHLRGKVSFKQILRFSLFMFAAVTAAIYTQNIDVILMSYLLNLSNTAVYSIAFFIGTIIQVPARNMNMVAASVVAEAWKESDHKKIQQLYTQTSLNQLIIGGFIFLLIWVNVNLLLSLLPPVYEGAKWVIFIIGIGKLFDMATGINGEIINVSKHVKVNLSTNLLLIVISTLSNYFFIQLYGISGAAIATAISLFAYNVIRMIFLFVRYGLQPFNSNTLKATVLLVAVFVIAFLLPALNNLWISGIYQTIIVSCLFILPLFAFRISPEINAAFLSVVSSLKASRSSGGETQ